MRLLLNADPPANANALNMVGTRTHDLLKGLTVAHHNPYLVQLENDAEYSYADVVVLWSAL